MSLEFKINFISGKNLVLVERVGYDTEIFIPIISNDRIQLVNVVNNRRCCASNTSILKVISNIKVEQSSNTHISPILPVKNTKELKKGKICIGLQNNNNKLTKLHNRKTISNTIKRNKIPIPIIEDPLNKSFIETSSTSINKNFNNVQYSTGTTSTPFHQYHKLKLYTNKNIKSFVPPNTVTKWRKCLTPIKTYSKNQPQGILLNRSPGSSVFCKSKTILPKTPRMIPIEKTNLPDYLRNQTKGCDGDAILQIKKIKLIIDRKLTISPKSFKKQLKHTNDLNKLPELKLKILKNSILNSEELLTTSNFRKCMSQKLQNFYTKKCIRRQELTDMKYEILIDSLPSLNTDNKNLNYIGLQPRKLII